MRLPAPMARPMNCSRASSSDIWLIVVGVIVLLALFGIVSSKLKSRRQRIAREKSLPYVPETVSTGRRYIVQLSDGRTYADTEILGTSDPHSGDGVFGGWSGMLVLLQPSGKRLFVRQSAVRSIEEQ